MLFDYVLVLSTGSGFIIHYFLQLLAGSLGLLALFSELFLLFHRKWVLFASVEQFKSMYVTV